MGYTKFDNEMLENIYKLGYTYQQMRVILMLIRETVGFNREWATISQGRIAKETGILQSHVSETIAELERKKIISVRRKGPRKPLDISVNEPDMWSDGGA